MGEYKNLKFTAVLIMHSKISSKLSWMQEKSTEN